MTAYTAIALAARARVVAALRPAPMETAIAVRARVRALLDL